MPRDELYGQCPTCGNAIPRCSCRMTNIPHTHTSGDSVAAPTISDERLALIRYWFETQSPACSQDYVRDLLQEVDRLRSASEVPAQTEFCLRNGCWQNYQHKGPCRDLDGMVMGASAAPVEGVADVELIVPQHPNNRLLFKRMCEFFDIKLGVDRIGDALAKIKAPAAEEKV